jgi:hypothetical protein
MGKYVWIGRERAAIGMARATLSAEARLIHHERAGRDRLEAAMTPAFMIPRKGPATEGERAALHLPQVRPRTAGNDL